MDTILVLTDFSLAAFNAARYAVKLANQLQNARVLIYHAFYEKSNSSSMSQQTINDVWISCIERLNELKKSLESYADQFTKIEIKTDGLLLHAAVENIQKERKVGIIVMGSTGTNKLSRLFIGSNTMSLSDRFTTPLLIVPPDAEFNTIERVVFACDVKHTDEIPVRTINNFLSQLHSRLSILYYESEIQPTNFDHTKKAVHKLLENINPDFSFIHGEEIADEVIEYARLRQTQLIVIAQKKQRFLQNIFHPSTGNKFSYYSHFPILILPSRKSTTGSLISSFNFRNDMWHSSNPKPGSKRRSEIRSWMQAHSERCGCKESLSQEYRNRFETLT